MSEEFEVGISITKLDSSNCDIVLVSSFKSLRKFESYLVHPQHKMVSGFIGKISESRVFINY
jgi:hypothetical protein